jgi:sporulation protein YlmC with PRC-barrel domain
MLTWREGENLPIQSLMELAVVDSNPASLGIIEDIDVTLPKANVGMIVGTSGMNGLRRNNVISGHHNHK